MSVPDLDDLLSRLDALQRQALEALESLPPEALRYATDDRRWNTVRRVMLRLGDHLREHTTQLAATREAIGAHQTMSQRLLARSFEAYGALMGAVIGLHAEDLDRAPAPGEWTPRQVLEHMVEVQEEYLDMIRRGLLAARPVERD